MARTRKVKPKRCPPAIADGIKTQAEVEPIRRSAEQKPKKRIKHVRIPNRRRKRKKKPVLLEEVELRPDPLPSAMPVQRWTTKSRKLHNEMKERMVKMGPWVKETKKRLRKAVRKLERELERKRKRYPRRYLSNGGLGEASQLQGQSERKETAGASSSGTEARIPEGQEEQTCS